MDWIDYREQLGIGFSDENKKEFFFANVFNMLNVIKERVTDTAYLRFCMSTGTKASMDEYKNDYHDSIVRELSAHTKSIEEFLSYYITFANIQAEDCKSRNTAKRFDYIGFIIRQMESAHISCEIVKDGEDTFLFPKGVAQFDKALVSEILVWLNGYPETKKSWGKALKAFSKADEDNASEVADAFRKALERLFQEFFRSSKSLENYKKEYGTYLSNHGIPVSTELI